APIMAAWPRSEIRAVRSSWIWYVGRGAVAAQRRPPRAPTSTDAATKTMRRHQLLSHSSASWLRRVTTRRPSDINAPSHADARRAQDGLQVCEQRRREVHPVTVA